MSDSKDKNDGSAILIIFTIATVSLVVAISYQSIFASFISGFMFCVLLEDHLKSKRELKELS